ncbi:hypothetical protein BGW36DRAFT_300226 [Talaromyces proteolyticus]|uniref:C3H1-type domain-containing protein n=1 Tax=Talaromyces proteolyticus TaxID=1131652 RepID=A0AAD4KR37_9EURO|nr:uncharacterized protein BGW36DRAFT_300226 [Talaromyces proteolyticus]KAH8694184.1 hypothetical protein BGW36DRAFT_300226 [Talaromyces proteolyticus]
MEQPPQQSNNAQGVHQSSVGQGSIPAEYWGNIEGLYPAVDAQQSPQRQQRQPHQQPQQQQGPQGITWDHPIFSQSNQQHQQSQITQQSEHVQDLYSANPQSWNQNSSAPQPSNIPQGQAYGLSHQHPYQMQQYPQDQMSYESPSLNHSELAYPASYSLSGQYYPTAGIQPTDVYPQTQHRAIAPRPASAQQAQVQPASRQTAQTHQYILPAPGYAENVNPNFNQYADTATNLNFQNTIDPRFLSGIQAAANQPQPGQDQFLFYNPNASSYDRPNDPKAYQMFPDNLATLNPEQLNARQHMHASQFSHLPELAPYPMPTSMQFPPVSENLQAALTKGKTGAIKKTKKVPTKGIKKAAGKSVSDSETDTSDSELEFEEPEEPSPLPPVRPADADGATQFDTMKAVWSPRNRYPSADKIKSSLVAFKDVVKAVRDEWKTQSQAMKDAENQNNNEKAAELKKKVIELRQTMNVVISTTLDKGHPIIIEKLGEHPMAVSALYSFLLDRHQASDHEGVLLVNILKLLARFTTMDEETLSKTNVAKLLPRIIKKGIQPGKDLAQNILEHAAASTKRKHETANSPAKDGTPDRTNDSTRADLATGTKRPRDGESNGLPATKKAAAPSLARAAVGAKGTSTSTAKGTADKTAAAAVAARPKASIVPPKPTSLFGSLNSASKKPGTSNAARAAAAAAAAKEKPGAPSDKKESPPPPPPPKPAFSFGDILADLNKKEDTKTPKTAENRPPETEEAREKRLRKEARRRLRVSWKPEDSLVQIRLFTHDPEEEIGADDDLKRDVGDIRGEGQMLKLHKDLDVDDDEEVGPQEEELRPWTSLIAIEMENLTNEDQSNNFIKRGGTKEPESPEKVAQDNREANTLMVFYTSPADVPPSPKEPAEVGEEEKPSDEQAFGEPDDNVKGRSARYFAMVNPPPPPKPAATTPAPTNGPIDIANLLKVIQSAPQQAQSTPPPQPAQPQTAPLLDLERTFSMFRQPQGQQQPVPQIPQIPQIPQLPQADAPANQPIDFQKILAVLNAQRQAGQPQPAPAIPIPQSQPSIVPNLAAIVSQLGGNNGAQSAGQPPSQYPGLYEDPERKRFRDMGHGFENGHPQGNAKRPRMYVDPEAKKHPRAGSVACRFWREGKCLKGEDCTFRHDPADLV